MNAIIVHVCVSVVTGQVFFHDLFMFSPTQWPMAAHCISHLTSQARYRVFRQSHSGTRSTNEQDVYF